MTDVLAEGMPTDIDLIRRLSPSEDRGLLALSVAEAVTDFVAARILHICGFSDSVYEFISLVRSCDFVVQRNGEWRLSLDAKSYLQPLCYSEPPLWLPTNRLLFAAANGAYGDDVLPAYLKDPAGRAYHLAALDPEAGVDSYAGLGVAAEYDVGESTTWLAARLANDQRALGVLPAQSIELDFLTAMSNYSEGLRQLAIEQLRPLAASKGVSMPIAVACHLVGRWDGNRNSPVPYRLAEKMLRRSIRIGEELKNYRHVAQAQHTLALILLMNARQQSEADAFALLDASMHTLIRERDEFGVAKVLHTYGQALSRGSTKYHDATKARAMLVRSLRIGRTLGKPRHEAAVLESLANIVEASQPQLANRARDVAGRMNPRLVRSQRPANPVFVKSEDNQSLPDDN